MPTQKFTFRAQKLRQKASKILQKLRLSKWKDDEDLELLIPTDTEVPRFVTFVRPTEAPKIIDLKAMRQEFRPQPIRIHTHQAPRFQAELNKPELRLQISFEKIRSPTETGTPLRRNPQQVFVFEATSHRSAAAALDDVADYEGYEVLEDGDSDLDWTMLDLPENVHRTLTNESRHSLL